MNWFKIASDGNFIKNIKEILKRHSFTQSIMEYYHIPLSDIDSHLEIEICDLNGKFSEGNGKMIRVDKKLLDKRFFKDNFHFVIHEFFHWVKRRNEKKFYFNDPEEIQSFVLQMTWDMISGKNREEVIEKIYPIIQGHYGNKQKAKQIFKEMVNKATHLYKTYVDGGEFSIE